MLDRIVILLLALAGLAERAAGAPGPVRCLVLWPLRRAEAVASEFVAGFGFAAADRSQIESHGQHGFGPADALSLALSVRMLAFALQAIVEQVRLSSLHPDQPTGGNDPLDRSFCRLIQTLRCAAWPQVCRVDTS